MNRRYFVGATLGFALTTVPTAKCFANIETPFDEPYPELLGFVPTAASRYRLALYVVLTSNHASISLVQRRLRLGYSATVLLFKVMEDAGVISRHLATNGYRKILLNASSRAALLNLLHCC